MTEIPYLKSCHSNDVLKNQSSSFFSSFSFLSEKQKNALKVYYAFSRIIDDCVDEITDAKLQDEALTYYENQVEKIYNSTPEHPVMKELAKVCQDYQIPKEYLIGLIDGCRMDILQKEYQNFDELYEYCYRVAGLVGLTCMQIFEYQGDDAKDIAVSLGLCFQITNILRDIKSDLSLGRVYLPKFGFEVDVGSGRARYDGVDPRAGVRFPGILKAAN